MFWIGSRLAGLVHRKGRRCFVCALCYWLLPPIALSLCYNVTLLLCYCVTVLHCYWLLPPISLPLGGRSCERQERSNQTKRDTQVAKQRLGTEQFKLWAGMLLPLIGCLDKYASNYAHTVSRCKNWNQVNTFQVPRWENGSGRRVRCSSRFPGRWKHVLTCGVEYSGYQI